MGNRSISTLPHNHCCGCRLCADACPKGCISFNEDMEGFMYPLVDIDICINCGICSNKCPEMNDSLNAKAAIAKATFADDLLDRESGSSGGVFGLLAKDILNTGGSVYGAAFDDNIQLQHKRAEHVVDLRQLCKSKYLQSDCSGIYKQIKDELNSGLNVMFCGTPCQCQALKNYVGNKNGKLLLVDFVCHGVPSQKLFNENLLWNERHFGKVKKIEFRHKDKKVAHPHTLKMDYVVNGKHKSILRMHYQDPYYFGFQKHISLRPSCYECKWARPERCSDITLADFWGVEKANIGLDSKLGVSCVLLNTEKGEKAHSAIINKLGISIDFPIDFAIEHNGCLGGATVMPKNRESFFADWQEFGYEEVVKRYLSPKRKWIFDVYYGIPKPIRKIIRKLMDKRMKYE